MHFVFGLLFGDCHLDNTLKAIFILNFGFTFIIDYPMVFVYNFCQFYGNLAQGWRKIIWLIWLLGTEVILNNIQTKANIILEINNSLRWPNDRKKHWSLMWKPDHQFIAFPFLRRIKWRDNQYRLNPVRAIWKPWE